MGFYDSFFGSEQTQYTAYAILAAISAISLTILFSSSDISLGNRFVIILFLIISVLPSVLLTLFELTCIVTGGTEPNAYWCNIFGWVLAAFIIIYCLFVVIISFMSLFSYNSVIDDINNSEINDKLPKNESDNYAKQIMNIQEVHKYDSEVNYEIHSQPAQNPVQAPTPAPVQQQVYLPNKEPTISVHAHTPASVLAQKTQPVPVENSKMFKVSGNEISNIGSYSATDKTNDMYVSAYNDAIKDCLNGKCYEKPTEKTISKFTDYGMATGMTEMNNMIMGDGNKKQEDEIDNGLEAFENNNSFTTSLFNLHEFNSQVSM